MKNYKHLQTCWHKIRYLVEKKTLCIFFKDKLLKEFTGIINLSHQFLKYIINEKCMNIGIILVRQKFTGASDESEVSPTGEIGN